MNLKTLLTDNDISQRELADGIAKSEALVSRLISGEARPNKETIDAILKFLTEKTGRKVTYEKAFGVPATAGKA